QDVRERLEDLAAEVADRGAQRVVREEVAEQRDLDAEDLTLNEVLDRLEDLVETVDDHRRVGEERKETRQLRAEARPRQLVLLARVRVAVAVREREDVAAAAGEGPEVEVDRGDQMVAEGLRVLEDRVVDRDLEALGAA